VCAGLLVAYLAVVWLDDDPSETGRSVRLPAEEEVVAVALPSGEDAVVLTRAGSGWNVSAKGEAPVPAAEVLVDALLEGLSEAAPAPATHRAEPLGAPRSVVLDLLDGDSVRIEVGRRRPGGHGCPAEVDGSRLDLPSTVDWLLDRPLEGWTRAIVTDLALTDIVRVEVRGSVSLEVARTVDGWVVDGQRADPHRVRVWLSYLAHLPALGAAQWEPADGAEVLEATLTLADGARETVSLACPEGLARTKSATWRVPGLVCTRLAATPTDLIGAPFLGSEPSAVSLEREGGGWAMERHGSEWALVEPGDQPLDQNAARLVAEYLADLAPPPVPVGPAPEGFEADVTVTVTTPQGEAHIAFGAPGPDGLVPIAVDDGPPLWVEQYQVDPVLPDLEALTRHP
jgi:hypothetical protein